VARLIHLSMHRVVTMVKLVTVVKMVLSGLQLCRCRRNSGNALLCYLTYFHSGSLMKLFSSVSFFARAPYCVLLSSSVSVPRARIYRSCRPIFGFRDAGRRKRYGKRVFLACPDPKLAEENICAR